jgi:hypothetical protein
MRDTDYNPWDYVDPTSNGDSYDDEFSEDFDDEPKLQRQPDPVIPDNAFEDDHQDIDYSEAIARLNADVEYWEAITRLNEIARPFDHGGTFASDEADMNPAVALEGGGQTSLNSDAPNDFDAGEFVDHVGPPIPTTVMGEADVVARQSLDPRSPVPVRHFRDRFHGMAGRHNR